MSDNPQKSELVDAEHKSERMDTEHAHTWVLFTRLTKWASLGAFWIVGMLVAVLGLHLPILPPLIVLSLFVAAGAYLMKHEV